MTRIAVTMGTLRVPPTYFALQHTAHLQAEYPSQFTLRTVTMALELDDPAVAGSALDIVEAAALPGGTFRRREVTMPLSFRRMTAAITDFDPDLIHQHFATWSTPAVRVSRRTGVPLIVTLHGADVFAALRPLSAVAARGRPMLAWHHASVSRALDRAARVLPVSRYLADRAIDAGARADRIEVHYQGIDADYFTPLQGARPDLPEVLFVGAFSMAKGPRDLVQASLEVVARHPHRLVLVGRGPLGESLRAAAREHPHIEVTGPLARDAVRDRLRRASVLVLPTQYDKGWREAAGLVLLEAQACGVPVITYDSGGAAEMVDAGRTGLVVPERDLAALARAIGDVLGMSSAEHTRMSSDAREWVVKDRSLRTSAERLAEIYQTTHA